MDNERFRVLKMVESGQISAEEAVKLLDALQSGESRTKSAGRNLRIRLLDSANRPQADVRVPLPLAQMLARAGIRLGAIWSPQLADVDLSGVLSAIDTGQPGRVVQWAEGDTGRQVEISVE